MFAKMFEVGVKVALALLKKGPTPTNIATAAEKVLRAAQKAKR